MQPLGGANSALVAKVAVLKVCRPMKSTLSECSTAGFWGEQVKTSGFPTVGQGWRGSILLSTTVDWFCSTSTAESKFLLTLTKFDVQMECSWPSFFSPRGLEPGVRGHRCWFFLYSKGEGNMSQKIVSSAKKKKIPQDSESFTCVSLQSQCTVELQGRTQCRLLLLMSHLSQRSMRRKSSLIPPA